MKKTNILILSPDRPIQSMGGLGVHVDKVLNNIDTNRFDVTAICQGAFNYERENGVKVFGLDPTNGLSQNKDTFSSTFLLQSRFTALAMHLILNNHIPKPDIVHICDWSTAVAGLDIAAATGAKPVFAVHLSIGYYIKKPNAAQYNNWEKAKQIEFLACQKSYRVLQVSKSYASLYPFNFFAHKTTIVPNGIDVEEFINTQPSSPEIKLPGENPIKLLYVGRIAPMKNVQTLMNISVPAGCDLIFIGGEQGSSKTIIDQLKEVCDKDPQKHYMGAFYGADKNYLMTQADLVITPSNHEPFGIVALEGLASAQGGKTLLASSFVGGMGDFLTPDAALNCGVTVESIEQCIKRFMMMTEAEKSSMRAEAVKLAQQYTWANATREIENIYCSLTNK